MTNHSLKEQLVKYLTYNQGIHASGSLQRIEWPKYAYGEKRGLHTPRSVVRRLEELTEEDRIEVTYKNNHEWYSSKTKGTSQEKFIYRVIEGIPTKIQIPSQEKRTPQIERRIMELMSADNN